MSVSTAQLAACGRDAPAEGQVVAVVDGTEITASELRAEAEATGATLADPSARNRVLERVVQRHLQSTAARQIGLDKDPRFLAHKRRSEQQILAQLYVQNVRVGAPSVEDAEAQNFILRNPHLFEERAMLVLDRIAFAPANAVSPAEVAAVQTMADAEQLLASKGIRFDRRAAIFDPVDVPPQVAPRLLQMGAGEVFFGAEGPAALFATIVERRPAPVPAAEQLSRAKTVLKRQREQQTLQSTLGSLRKQAKVTYQKGYAAPSGPPSSRSGQPPR